MNLLIDLKGAQELAAALRQAKQGTPNELRLGMEEALLPIVDEMKTYPAQPPWMGAPGHRPPTKRYVRTGNYRNRITTHVSGYGGVVEGTINSAASYSNYLRGDLNGYSGAWMHRGIWRTLEDIIADKLEAVQARLERRIAQYLNRLGLGD